MNQVKRCLKLNVKEYVALGVALMFCFCVHILVITQFTNWYSTDVVGYLSHAATFSGKDWSGVMRNANFYYSWGYSLFLAIPMFFTNNITNIYYAAVVINALFSCGILLLSYWIGRIIAPEVNKYVMIFISAAVSVYSSYIFQGAVMLSEMCLYFFVFLCAFFLLKYLETMKMYWGILAGIAVGYTYIVHNRAVALPIAFVIVAVFLTIRLKNWKCLLVMLIPLFGMLLLNTEITSWLDVMEKQGQEYTKNTYAQQVGRMSNAFGFYSIISMIQCALGEMWYLIIGTFGVAAIGIIAVIKKTITFFKNPKKFAFGLFLLLQLVGTLGVSVLFCFPKMPLAVGSRYELFFYGRYWETVFGIFLLIGLVEIVRGCEEAVNRLLWIAGLFLSVFVEYISRLYQTGAYNYWAIPAVLTTYFSPEHRFTVVESSIIGLIFMAFLFCLIKQKQQGYRLFAVVCWSAFCIFTGWNSVYGVSYEYRTAASITNMPLQNEDFVQVCDYIQQNNIDEYTICSMDGYRAISFQVVCPEKKVMGVVSTEQMDQINGVFIVDKAMWSELPFGNLVYENSSYSVYVE